MEEVSSNAVEIRSSRSHAEWGTRRTRFNVRATSPRCARNSRCWMQNLISLFGRSDYERVGWNKGGRADNPCIADQRTDVGDRKGSNIAEQVITGVEHTLGNILLLKSTTVAILNEVVSVKKESPIGLGLFENRCDSETPQTQFGRSYKNTICQSWIANIDERTMIFSKQNSKH